MTRKRPPIASTRAAVQFIGVEVFFRGFLVLGLAPRMGVMAVYVSVIPYVMIHFAKPMLETLGAIVAAIALGHLPEEVAERGT